MKLFINTKLLLTTASRDTNDCFQNVRGVKNTECDKYNTRQ